MTDPRDKLVANIIDYLESIGLDPLHTFTVLSVIILISYQKKVRNWEQQKDWQKGIILSTAFCTSLLVIVSLLRIIGVINF
ncbi:hypothetical protein J6I44_17605 [Aliifodinibius sp. 1BSP15-2V2]|uniref:Uncharacterized protein n=1 Tax=Fodinibius salsisoli TaxID=2820877 RepID=A0ABT3PS38_9BACT|nr:hypothetical protein [Fodinibius salsisoli]